MAKTKNEIPEVIRKVVTEYERSTDVSDEEIKQRVDKILLRL
jgi:hypothetical protein